MLFNILLQSETAMHLLMIHSMCRFLRLYIPRALCFGVFTLVIQAQSAHSTPAGSVGEQRATRAFETARRSPLELTAFLRRIPKGGDLHMHLSGAIYAETFIRDAEKDALCFNSATRSLSKAAKVTGNPLQPECSKDSAPAADAFHDQSLYDAMVDAFSMRSFVPSAGVSGHDQFFATFARFGAIDRSHAAEWLDEVARRAADQNEQYVEVMQTPFFSDVAALAAKIPWPNTPADPAMNRTGDATGTSRNDLAKLRDQLLAGGLRQEVEIDRQELNGALTQRNHIEGCGEPSAMAACSVKIRFIYQVLRGFPPQQVFAQTLLGFEVAQAEAESGDPHVVGINFVMPEDGYMAMSEYHRQMLMLDYLHGVYPKVHISLHAGELAFGLVPPDGLRFHIREAVELGHAERIGHGVDIMYEDEPQALLKEMALHHILTEINLSSNELILGVSRQWHPLPIYRAAGVPVALSTDDEGVSRIDITHEYAKAAMDFGLSYTDLKRMARASLEHSFLPGQSLWASPDVFTRVNAACAGQQAGAVEPSARCQAFLKANARAAEQWELEHRYNVFEASFR
jgi:adenosine deaminase